MSWWDAKQLTSFATQALKTAQKKIDKVLDIKEAGGEENEPVKEDENFFNKWLSPENKSQSTGSFMDSFLSTPTKESFASDSKNSLSFAVEEKDYDYKERNVIFTSDGDITDYPELTSLENSNFMERKLSKSKLRKAGFGSGKSAFKKFKGQQSNEEVKICSEIPDSENVIACQSDVALCMVEDDTKDANHVENDAIKNDPIISVSLQLHPEQTQISGDFKDVEMKFNETVREIESFPGNSELDEMKSDTSHTRDGGVTGAIVESLDDEMMKNESDERVEKTSNLFDMTSSVGEVDVSKCWSDASLSDMILCQEVEKLETAATDFTKESSLNLGGDDDDDDGGLRCDVIACESDENITQKNVEELEVKDTVENEVLKISSGQSQFNVDESHSKSTTERFDSPGSLPMKESPYLDCSSSFSESTSANTLVAESSLENSTCTSDDISEINKTLTGDETVSTSSSTINIQETQSDSANDETPKAGANFSFDRNDDDDLNIYNEVNTIGDPETCRSREEVVQDMIEEAMMENTKECFEVEKIRDVNASSPGEGNAGENMHQDGRPAESGQTSGHTSADEIDTTTSSDIEIISQMSTPSFLGNSWRHPVTDKHAATTSSGVSSCFDLSPSSKRMGNRASSPSGVIGHRRSDSGSSGQSLQSRNGEDFVSIDYASVNRGYVDVRHRKQLYPDVSSQLTSLSNDNEMLMKKLAEVEDILEVREKKVLELSQENLNLLESNSILKNQLSQAESMNDGEREDLKSISDEFMKRIGESERKLQVALRECDFLKKTLQDAELEKKSNNVLIEKVVKEKEQTITELLAEGEKLSKQQLQSNNILKKLRAKDKENESLIKSLKDKNEDQKAEIERLETILEGKLEAEKKYVDTINQMNAMLKSNEDEIVKLRNDLEDAVEKSKSFKMALDNSYKEMSELHRARMTDVTEAQRAAATVEMSARDQLMRALDEQKLNAKKIENQLVLQIEDLQLNMTRVEKEHGRREDSLRQEISDLQQRLQEAEERNQELTQSVSSATRPLLRQIENIQTTYSVQSNNFERIEKNLSDRLAEAQNQLASAVEKERIASENLSEFSVRVTALDVQVSSLRQDKARLQAELEMERSKVGALEETKHIVIAQKETMIRKLEDEIKDFKKEKMLLENQVEMEKIKVDTEKKKYTMICDQLNEKEIQLQTWSLKSTPTPLPSDDVMKHSTSSTPVIEDYNDRNMSSSSSSRLFLEGVGRQSVYESIRGSSGSTVVENLQSLLKLREGEVTHLQTNISELEKTRESLSRELVTISTLNEDLTTKLESLLQIEVQYQDVSQRHNALLQMYGEKVEEAEELRMDLQDIKEIYKCQMDELLELKSLSIPR